MATIPHEFRPVPYDRAAADEARGALVGARWTIEVAANDRRRRADAAVRDWLGPHRDAWEELDRRVEVATRAVQGALEQAQRRLTAAEARIEEVNRVRARAWAMWRDEAAFAQPPTSTTHDRRLP